MALEKKIPHIPILCKKRKRRFLRVFHFLGAVGQKERRHIWKRFHKRFHTTTQPPSNSQTPCNKTLHHLRGEKKKKKYVICSVLYWLFFFFLAKLTKTGKPNNNAEPANEFKATTVLPLIMSKVCSNSFAVAYNDKAYALFSSRRLR